MSRPMISESYLNPLIFGFIAHTLRKGIYPSLLSVNLAPPSNPVVLQRLQEELAVIIWTYTPELYSKTLVLAQQRGEYSGRHPELFGVLRNLSKHALYQDSLLKQHILQVVPNLTGESDEILFNPPSSPYGPEDARVLALARWFKHQFMAWRDPILCQRCQGRTEGAGSDDPTDVERRDGGGRVELHRCLDHRCGEIVRFVRYNDPFTLLKTRTGRCGEWAHLFYEVLRAVGLNARYIWNSEDHVWTEYWSPTLRHWVHIDSCEAAVGKPLLYARGWGKKQCFCLAAGSEGIQDVTRSYVDDWNDCLSRRAAKQWNEETLAQAVAEGTLRLRLSMSREEVIRCEEHDRLHTAWMEDEPKRWREAQGDDLGGRISGPEDWRAARDELGGEEEVHRPAMSTARTIHNGLNRDTLMMLGKAESHSDGITLTSQADQVSAIYSQARVSQFTSFRVEMSFRLTAPSGSDGADGIALVFMSEPVLGEGGFGLGYTRSPGRQGDFAVEVDTFRSYDFAADPITPHVSVHSPPHAHHRNSIVCTKPSTLPPLNDGKVYTLELVYQARDRSLTGWIRVESEEMVLWRTTIPCGDKVESNRSWHVGVTGSTGGLWQKQEVLSLLVDEVVIEDDLFSMETDDT